MSRAQLYHRQIAYTAASNTRSQVLDSRKGLSNYVHLCVDRYHPMEHVARRDGRINSVIWLAITEKVIGWNTTRFSNKNANTSNAIVDEYPETAFDSNDPQAEVLIRGSLAARFIQFPMD